MQVALLLCRWVVGAAFMVYGLVKIFGGQFHHGDFVIDSTTTDPTSLVWCFFGYSPTYARFLGLCEFIPGLLILFPRTKTFGALALLPVTLNITVMDFCFGFPAVKYTSLFLTVLCALLVLSDWRKLKPIFWDEEQTESGAKIEGDERAETSHLTRDATRPRIPKSHIVLAAGAICVGLFLVNLAGVALGSDPIKAAVAKCIDEGWKEPDLTLRSWRRTAGDFGIQMEAIVEFDAANDGRSERIQVFMHRSHGMAPWRAIRIERGQ